VGWNDLSLCKVCARHIVEGVTDRRRRRRRRRRGEEAGSQQGLWGLLHALAAYIPALRGLEGVRACAPNARWEGVVKKVGKHSGRYKTRLLRLEPGVSGGCLQFFASVSPPLSRGSEWRWVGGG
jgi:hypothetical protein